MAAISASSRSREFHFRETAVFFGLELKKLNSGAPVGRFFAGQTWGTFTIFSDHR
jgi:hypothetical protein